MSAPFELKYTASATVGAFARSDAAFRLIMGPLGSGKTTGCIMEVFRRCAEQVRGPDGYRHSRWAFVRNTAQQLRDTTLKSWLEWFPDGVAGRWRAMDSTFFLEVGDIRAEILFRPLDTEEDQRRLLSLNLTAAYINELRELPLELVNAIRSRTGRFPSAKDGGPTWHGTLADTNPPSKDHWIYEMFEVVKPRGWEIFKQPGGLDPGAENRDHLPPGYYEDLLEGASADWAEAHVHGRYSRSLSGRPVYGASWNADFHVAKEPLRAIESPHYPIVIGMDFGRTPAAVLKQRDARGRVLTLDECYAEGMGLSTFLKEKLKPFLSTKYPRNRFVVCGDPAGWAKSQLSEKHAGDVLKEYGFSSQRAPTNDPERRIEAVERLLMLQTDGAAHYLVSPTCEKLIAGFNGGYKFKTKKDGSYEASPLKNEFSHLHDANQYGDLVIEAGLIGQSFGSGEVPVERVSWAAWT